ncbi:MAG: hypothetical protein ABI164_05585 [Acidobacteriaceae bacterium]
MLHPVLLGDDAGVAGLQVYGVIVVIILPSLLAAAAQWAAHVAVHHVIALGPVLATYVLHDVDVTSLKDHIAYLTLAGGTALSVVRGAFQHNAGVLGAVGYQDDRIELDGCAEKKVLKLLGRRPLVDQLRDRYRASKR